MGSVSYLSDTLEFYQFDCCVAVPVVPIPEVFRIVSRRNQHASTLPVIRLFGITRASQSVCCHVHGYEPYLFLRINGISLSVIPDILRATNELIQNDILGLCQYLDIHCKEYLKTGVPPVTEIRAAEGVEDGMQNYFDNTYKVSFVLPGFGKYIASILERGFTLSTRGRHVVIKGTDVRNSLYLQSFMTTLNLSSSGWLHLEKYHYLVRSLCSDKKETNCKIEVDVHYTNIVTNKCMTDVYPFLKILSLDIEVVPGLSFPLPGKNPVLQIGNIVTTFGTSDSKRVIFVTGDSEPIKDTIVFSHDDEGQMLRAWHQFVLETDPDIITGYNILGFDLPYLVERCTHMAPEIRYIGRVLGIPIKIRDATYNRGGYFKMSETEIVGRVILDTLKLVRYFCKGLHDYSLRNVSLQYLEETKFDVDVHKICSLNQTSSGRKLLSEYCLQDAKLAHDLLISENLTGRSLLLDSLKMTCSPTVPLKEMEDSSEFKPKKRKCENTIHKAAKLRCVSPNRHVVQDSGNGQNLNVDFCDSENADDQSLVELATEIIRRITANQTSPDPTKRKYGFLAGGILKAVLDSYDFFIGKPGND